MNNDVTEWKLRLVTVRELSSAWGRQPMNGGADKPMAGPYIEALDATPFGDTVSDFDRLSATTTEAVVRAVDPAIARIRDLLRPKVMTGRDLVVHMHSITAAAEDALSALDAVIPNEVTVEQLVDQFERDYLLSLAVTLTSQGAIAAKVNSWHSNGRLPGFLDVATFRIVDSPGQGRTDMHHVASATSAGVTTHVLGEGLLDIGPYPQVQAMLYGQWFTHIFAVWEERYRGRLALAHELAADGKRWRRTDILIPLFGDIRTLRNDFVHNQGTADESIRNTLLTWGVQDEPLKITVQQMITLIELFPRAELMATPTRASAANPINFPWPVAPELVEDIRVRADVLKRTRKSRRQIGDEALKLWLDANPEPV
ncbi:hypothetical protein ABIE52_004585 [Rhodococcus sp. OAS809]|uniref:hypothetical protein n=1 Tax=Rhodococcus sp. OAS809 TaxID=2663874 RepID=UPI00178B134E